MHSLLHQGIRFFTIFLLRYHPNASTLALAFPSFPYKEDIFIVSNSHIPEDIFTSVQKNENIGLILVIISVVQGLHVVPIICWHFIFIAVLHNVA